MGGFGDWISDPFGTKRQAEAQENATNLAREQQAQAVAEQQRLEEKYGLTPGELAREQRLFGIPQGEEAIKFAEGSLGLEPQQQTELERRAGMSGEELLKEVGPDTRALLEDIASRQGKTGEELFREEGGIPQALADQILVEVKNPEQFYQDTLNQQLEQARTMVNAEANRRGVFGGLPEGGIRFENLGRAGVDLAIKSASEKMAQRQQALANASVLASLFTNLSAGARGEQGTVSQSALSEKEKARNNLMDFLQLMEQSSASAKGRAAEVATGTSRTAQGTIGNTYSNLIGLEAYKGSIQNPVEKGLSTLGEIGADYLANILPTPSTKTTTTTTPTTYEEFLKANPSSDPLANLSDITGSNKKRQYALLQ